MKLKRQSVDLRSFLTTEIPQKRLSPDLRQRVRHALASGGDLAELATEATRELVAARVFERAGVIRRGSDRVTVHSLPGSPRVYDLQSLLHPPAPRPEPDPKAVPEPEPASPAVDETSEPPETPHAEPTTPGEAPGPSLSLDADAGLHAIDAIRRTLERDWVSFGLESSLEGLLELLTGHLGNVELRVLLWSEPLGLNLGQGRCWRVLHEGPALEEAFRRSLQTTTSGTVAYEGRQWTPLRVADEVVGAVGAARALEGDARTTVARTLEALLMAHRRSQQRVYTDPLTGLHNRRFFDTQLGLELERALRLAQPLAMLFVDLDHFKKINDEKGHQVGDLVLQHVSRLMLQHLRRIDQVFRWGGEEFALLLPGTGRSDAIHTAERLRAIVERTPLVVPGGGRVSLTVSVGVALAPEHAKGGERALLRHADQALYRAKDEGRNRVCLYDGDDDAPEANS